MKKLEGRIISLAPEGHQRSRRTDVPFGTGRVDIKGVLTEAKRQGLKSPVFSIEYESSTGDELVANVRKCIEYFNATVARIGEVEM